MKNAPKGSEAPNAAGLQMLFSVLFGAFLGLALLKFGNPPIMEKYITAPANAYEFVLGYPWPAEWAYAMLGVVALIGLVGLRGKVGGNEPGRPARWLGGLLLLWLGWQLISATHTLDGQLTKVTLVHFIACVVCFYLGFFSLNRLQEPLSFWVGLSGGFLCVLVVGWEQHFGGLEETRRYFFVYVYPKMKDVAPEYLKKMSSNRIFSTLFYPNALAGALVLLLPSVLAAIWRAERYFTVAARRFLMGAFGLGALACLYWSGSKGGWLLMLSLTLIALLRLPFERRLKVLVVAAVLLAGVAGFIWKYSGFFQRGATSVSARFDYWRAAILTAEERPVFGSGPGTFAIPYQRIKRPESEMARLVHNDYLEQASDSGVVGALLYTGFITAALFYTWKKAVRELASLEFGAWLGLVGWSLQGLFEFGLYIPALAWSAFALFGWLLGRDGRVRIPAR